MTTLRTMGGSLTMADGVLEVVHAGVTVQAAKKAASPLRFPLEAVERVEHVPQSRTAGGHLRVHLIGDDRPHGKVATDVRTAQLKHLRSDGQRDVEGFVHAVNEAAAAAGERPWTWPAPPAPQHEPARQSSAAVPREAASEASAAPVLQGRVVDAPRRAEKPPQEPVAAGDREHRSTMRLLRVAEFAAWVQIAALLLPVFIFVAVLVVVLVVIF